MQVLSERVVAEAGDGVVSVTKAVLDLARDNVVGVKLSVESAATEPVTVTVEEPLPAEVSSTAVQVHPSYHPERWTTDQSRRVMTFETAVDPGGSIETVYGARIEGTDPDAFAVEPNVRHDAADSADLPPPEAPSGLANAGGEDPTTEALGPAEPADARTEVDDSPERPVAQEPAADPPSATYTPQSDADGSTIEESFEFGDTRDGPGATRLSTQTGAGPDASIEAAIESIAGVELTDAQRAALRRAADLGPSESERLQLSQLQSAVAELSAYAEEFGRFVDAVGSPADAVSELRSAHAQLAESVADLASAVDSAGRDRADLRSRVDAVESDLRTLRGELTSEVASIEDRLRRELTAEDDRVREMLTEELEEREARLRRNLSAELDGLEDRLRGDVATDLATIDDRVRELESVLGAEEFQGIREVIAAERAWRQRFETSRSDREASAASGADR